ncbi:MAG: phenylalanine--tRNA ligase subunit beta, partial [Pseudomonadota bacterium]
WLREWVNPTVSTDELCHQLTMAGLEVDAVDPVAGEFTGVLVGEVVKVEPHPDADKLRVTQVNVGGEALLSIVCGAPNVREGMKAPTAVVGAKLPGDFKIKKAKLRGVPSFGMLCSASELGLAESAEGLMELPADAPVGETLRDYLLLDDVTIELGLTPNRGDCLSIAGIAREVGVLNQCDLAGPAIEPVAPTLDETFSVQVEASGDCPRYIGRVIRGIDTQAQTPLWLQERLRRSGIRSLGPVVDVTNYVLLELGQPMHAFDLAKLKEGVIVRRAHAGEELRLLNEQTVELDSDTLVIADAAGPLAMAGVMGGEASAVGDATVDIFLESAFFSPESIVGRARRYGLHTDSSHRFERGVDPQLTEQAMERATTLLLAIVGGSAGPLEEVLSADELPTRHPVLLRHQRLNRLLGAEVAASEVEDILQRLGMGVEPEAEGWHVTAPAFRFDIAIEVDLVEEIGRIVGYENLPSSRPQVAMQMQPRPEGQVGRRQLSRVLVERGYQEAISYSFVEPKLQQLLDPEHEGIPLANPISSDLAVMRTTLWSGLLPLLQHNLNRQQNRVKLFEYGLRFIRQGEAIHQENMLAGIACGTLMPEQWGADGRQLDFYDIKADLEALIGLTRRQHGFRFVAEAHSALHPGQSARIYFEQQPVGWIGTLHPRLEKALDLRGSTLIFEISAAALSEKSVPKFMEISKYPAIRRDLAVVVDESVSADAVLDCISRAAPESLKELKLFDLYAGEHIDSGRKSLALGLTLQAQSRTLTDEEVDAAIKTIVTSLGSELGATLRE